MNVAFPPIDELLPHRAPMLLIDALVEHGVDGGEHATHWAVCEVRPKADAWFMQDGELPALLMLEYMAQAVGALAGLLHRAQGEPARIGYLIAARQLVLHVPTLEPGVLLRVHVRNAWSGDGGRAGQFECRVECAGTPLANAVLTVYEPPAGALGGP